MEKNYNAVVQAPFLGLIHKDCLSCREPIYNPLCPDCISREFKVWISKYPEEIKEEILSSLSKFLEDNSYLKGSSHKCIACGRNNVYLCPYCFTEFLFNLLKKSKSTKINKTLLGEFLMLFNFDFEHTGYYKDGEKLGIF